MFSEKNEDIPKYKLTESLVCAENLGRKTIKMISVSTLLM